MITRPRFIRITLLALTALLIAEASPCSNAARAEFKAGAVAVDVTPRKLPVIVNGNLLPKVGDVITSRLHARALAVSDGKTTVVIVVVDSCMMSKGLIDEAKLLASRRTGIPTDRMLVSVTHTHSAGSVFSGLGTPADENYTPYLKEQLAETIVKAAATLKPAKVGFSRVAAPEYTALRRWIRRPDRLDKDPFGNMTVRANMHAAGNLDNVTGPSGPEDPELSLISIQSLDGKPIAVFANFSMHYFSGEKGISADYFGLFCEGLKQRIAPGTDFVAIMSHGCSGDIWRRDYSRPDSWKNLSKIDQYAAGLADLAAKAYRSIQYRKDADVAMIERRMTFKYRVPDAQRLEWAKRIATEIGDRPPKTQVEIYALEQIILHERQQTEIVLQGLRIGDIGIATTPTETYAITGLKIKAASPLENTMVIDLANGGDGYIPPPEQHVLGGYNTWAARSAGLEVSAEPRITEACIELLEQVSGRERRSPIHGKSPAANAIAKLQPAAWWRLDEFAGPRAFDSSGNHSDAIYEPAVTYYLKGPRSPQFSGQDQTNRAAMFAGGRLKARVPNLGDDYSVSMWLWNGMPNNGRDVSGWLFSRGPDNGLNAHSDHLGIGGKSGHLGCLVFFHGADASKISAGKTEIPRWQWQHVVYVREGESVNVYLNGKLDLKTKSKANFPTRFDQFVIGGRSDNHANWEGRLDEVAIFKRALNAKEVAALKVP